MLRLLLLFVTFILISCASSKTVNRDPEKVNDVMVTFVEQAQAGNWKKAMEYITPEERDEMMDGSQVTQDYRDAVNRIRLSTIKNMDLGLDGKGRLVGVLDILDESNRMFQASEEKIAVDPSKLEDLSVKRRKEEEAAKKKMLENSSEPEKSEWDVYYGDTRNPKKAIEVEEEEDF
ncbi:MAG: hypothetical protein FWB90_09020 [Fibromonadales bacterium]|nr:hypothetical protein [Fibromonadales bacterium]